MRAPLTLAAGGVRGELLSRLLERLLIFWVTRAAGGTRGRVAIWRTIRRSLASGLSIRRALETAIDAAPRNRARALMLRRWQFAYADGTEALAAEVAKWVPASEALIFGALTQGNAKELIESAARVAEIVYRQVKTVRGAVVWPVVIVGGTLVMVWWAGGFLLPRFEGYSDPEKWTTVGVIGNAVATGVYRYDAFIAAGVVLSVALVWIAVLRWTGPGRARLDEIAPFSMYRVVSGTAFLLMVLELMKLGVPLNEATWERLSARASPYVRSRMAAIQLQMVRGGMGFGRAMRAAGTGFPDHEIVAVGGALAGRDGWHEEMAGFLELWVEESEESMKAAALGLNMLLGSLAVVLSMMILSPLVQMFIHLDNVGR